MTYCFLFLFNVVHRPSYVVRKLLSILASSLEPRSWCLFFSSFVMFTIIQTQCHTYGFKGSVNSNGYTRLVISDCWTEKVNAYYYTDLVNADCSTSQVIFDSFKGPVFAFCYIDSVSPNCFTSMTSVSYMVYYFLMFEKV